MSKDSKEAPGIPLAEILEEDCDRCFISLDPNKARMLIRFVQEGWVGRFEITMACSEECARALMDEEGK